MTEPKTSPASAPDDRNSIAIGEKIFEQAASRIDGPVQLRLSDLASSLPNPEHFPAVRLPGSLVAVLHSNPKGVALHTIEV